MLIWFNQGADKGTYHVVITIAILVATKIKIIVSVSKCYKLQKPEIAVTAFF